MQISLFGPNISHELNFLLHASLLGAVITFVYDNLRILRRVIRHHNFVVSLEDLLFWIGVSISVFTLQFYENNGIFRWFSVLGALFGMLIYRGTLGRFYVTYMAKLLTFILKMIGKIIAFILRPILFMERKTEQGASKIWKKVRRMAKVLKLRLTKQIKVGKLILCKRKERRISREKKNTSA